MRDTVVTSIKSVTVLGFDGIVLENALLRAVILPSLGGRVWELMDKRRERQWIWHRGVVPLARTAAGAAYDEVWAGGWEELFPNDAPGWFEGRDLPDHGEWWTLAWSVSEATAGVEAVVRLEAETEVRRTRCVKEFRLAGDSDRLVVSYRVESLELEPFHFLFKQHLPLALTTACRLTLPGGLLTPVEPAFGTLLPGPGPFPWPIAEGAGGRVDLREVPPASLVQREFVYISGMPEGWCGVDDLEHHASLRMSFDQGHLPFVWLFLTYGGWRSCYTAVLEPCTNMPKDLSSAVRIGQCAHLDPGEIFETQVVVTLCGSEEA